MSETVYLNGALIPRSQARISVLDYGFLYGFGLFETMRAYGGQVFCLDRHLSRLARSAEILGLPIKALELKGAVMDTIQANRLSEARVRVTVSIGEGGIVPDPSTCSKPTILILAGHYQPYPEPVYQKGFRAIVSSIRRNSQSPLSRLKSANYLESILARQEAKAAGVDEALCLSEKGLLAEASMSNIFLVSDGILQTPKEENGILPGITREVLLELASQLSIGALERDIRLEEVFQAQEAFLTNSLMEIMPLTKVSGMTVGSGIPGPVTRKLVAAYRELVLASRTSEQ
ncbi:aminotransferase class IV [Chloroflexota bacterium]